jgi:hypothetical protein
MGTPFLLVKGSAMLITIGLIVVIITALASVLMGPRPFWVDSLLAFVMICGGVAMLGGVIVWMWR